MRVWLGIAAVAIMAVALSAGDGPALLRSLIHGFGWGIGREVAHDLVHHVLH
jgi:hypothetical protein